jgi:hypothetical protein
MMTFKQIITAACLLIAAGNTNGQRLTTQTYQLGIGGTNILDTYLSQEKFSGVGVTFLATREWQKADSRWSTMMEHEANFASTDDRADKRTELQGDYTLLVGRYYSWQWNRLKLQAGGMTTLNAGVIYNLSNTNNPAQARFSLQLMPAATAAYDITLAGFPDHFFKPFPLDRCPGIGFFDYFRGRIRRKNVSFLPVYVLPLCRDSAITVYHFHSRYSSCLHMSVDRYFFTP